MQMLILILGKYQVDAYMRELGLPGTFLYTGNFYENMVLRGHVQYDKESDSFEFRQPVIKLHTKRGFFTLQYTCTDQS